MENISLKLSPKSFLLFLFDKLIFVEVISILNNSLICLYYSMLIFKHIIKFKIFQSTQWCSIFIDFFNRKRRTCQVFPRGDGATTTTATETKTKQQQQQQQQSQMHSRSANGTCEIVFCYYTCMTVRIIY